MAAEDISVEAIKFRTIIIPLPFGREWRIKWGGPYFKINTTFYSGWVKPVRLTDGDRP